jgi:hypothetical protein
MAETEMEPAFEVFLPEAVRPTPGQVAVSVQKGGILALSPAAYEAMGQPAAVELLFARKERVIGMRPVDPATVPHSYKVREHKASRSHLITGRRYLKHYGIDHTTARRYPATMVNGVLTAPLEPESSSPNAGTR